MVVALGLAHARRVCRVVHVAGNVVIQRSRVETRFRRAFEGHPRTDVRFFVCPTVDVWNPAFVRVCNTRLVAVVLVGAGRDFAAVQDDVAFGLTAQMECVLTHFLNTKFRQRKIVNVEHGMMEGDTWLLTINGQSNAPNCDLSSVCSIIFGLIFDIFCYRKIAAPRRDKHV